uniref:CCHC-type domain-containing protein n=1 Tax=Fagus sylvatica TaxID=28930 RepID=A0A2N9G6B4_FAGSY
MVRFNGFAIGNVSSVGLTVVNPIKAQKDYDGDLDMDDSSNDEIGLACTAWLDMDQYYRKFSVRHLQHIIDSAWRVRGNVTVVGRDSYYYILHFDVPDDLVYICDEGPWAYPELAIQMGHMLGVYERIDWDAHIPRNIRFMRIRVRMNPWLPLIAGFMLRLDDGNRVWIQCRYERIHKVCTKCGMMGHTRTQCTYLMTDIEQLLHRQRQRIQEEFHVQYGFDPMEPHFVNELRAFYNRPQRWSTQIRFGPLSRDTGYRHRQHQQGGPPPPQPTMQSFMEAIQNDMHEANQEPPLTHHAVHTSNEEPPTPIQSPAPDNHNQHTTPPDQDHTQPVTTQSLWQPPENSNLQWVWLDGEGPFLTNASLDQPPIRDNLKWLKFRNYF